MIAKCNPMGHCAVDIDYITGESVNKKHPEKIFHVLNKFLDDDLDAAGIWDSMKMHFARYRDRHPKLTKPLFRIELSPPKEYTVNFTIRDWQDLWNEFLMEYDGLERFKNGKPFQDKTNLMNSMQTIWLHLESKGGTPHLHGAVSRIDVNGELNGAHFSVRRAGKAAEKVAMRRGWTTAMEVHENRVPEVTEDCRATLRSMYEFDIDAFFLQMEQRGYEVKKKIDTKGVIHGYALVRGNCKYKASELGKGGEFKVGRIEETWKRLHDELEKKRAEETRMVFGGKMYAGESSSKVQMPNLEGKIHAVIQPRDYTKPFYGSVQVSFNYEDEDYTFHIPEEVYDWLNGEFAEDVVENSNEIIGCAILAFVECIDAATTVAPSTGGSGSTADQNDEKKRREEEDMEKMQRCARFAVQRHPVVRKSRSRHR